MSGKFIISLDYELHWGFFDNTSLIDSKARLSRVNAIIEELIELSEAHGIKLTFATVGLLFAKDKSEALSYIPQQKPNYTDNSLNAYELYQHISEEDSAYYFANTTIHKINASKSHEIGTHTFSHYYCYEEGQSVEDFKADLSAAIAIADKNAITTRSIVFPRNQTLEDYVSVCEDLNIESYRGNCWYNFNNTSKKKSLMDYARIGLRVLDTYFNITGSNSYHIKDHNTSGGQIINIPASRFLRPYHKKLKHLESLKVRRIKKAMTKAAKSNKVYHLWWHPHNFGENKTMNFNNLKQIFEHYSHLQSTYNFKSCTMTEAAVAFKNKRVV